ncbi:alkaline-phosphatase-like protein [Chytridium lagenaria]|nr:alkaline-phosphatase-like protein [Chytridium lagenaria]
MNDSFVCADVLWNQEFARQKRWLMFWGITLVVLILGTTITLGVLLSKKPETVKHGRGVPGNGTYPTVIMISLDGFRSDYLDRGLSPSLSKLAHDGVRAEYLRPSFPSITFPNHYTLVTGLYPESHGIVANVFFDPRLNDTFVYVDSEKNGQSKWWGGEPLWVTAIKQGRISATCMWPGSEAPIQNIRPNYWLKYDGKMTLTARADQILKWLDLPHNERPSFMTLYASDVDLAGHNFGPNSKAVNDSIVNVDRMVGRIVKGLEKRNLTDSVNVIIVSDHGMTEANNNWIFLDDFVSYDSITIVNNLIISIYPKNMNELETIYATLKNASLKSGNWDIWKREEVPEYLHYSNNLRIAPLVAMPRKNYGISLRKEFDPEHNARGGLHGYNNSDVDMQAIFVAAGPAFRPTLLPMFVNQTLIDFHGNSSNVFNASSVKPSLSHEALADPKWWRA